MRDEEKRDLEERLAAAEEDGAEIAQRASTTINELKAEIARLKRGGTGGDGLCRPCETKRRILGFLAGLPIGAWYFGEYPWHQDDWTEQATGLFLSLLPLMIVACHWRVLQFMRRVHWVSCRDNDCYRALQQKWNAFLYRLAMR